VRYFVRGRIRPPNIAPAESDFSCPSLNVYPCTISRDFEGYLLRFLQKNINGEHPIILGEFGHGHDPAFSGNEQAEMLGWHMQAL